MHVLLAALLLPLFVFLFFREDRLAYKRYLERDRLNDAHILREIEKFLKQKATEENV